MPCLWSPATYASRTVHHDFFQFSNQNECCIGAKSSFLRLFGHFLRQALNMFAQCCTICLVLYRTPLNAPQDSLKVPKSPCPFTGVTLNTLISLITADHPNTQNARSPMPASKAAGLPSRAVKLFLPVLGLYVCLAGPEVLAFEKPAPSPSI